MITRNSNAYCMHTQTGSSLIGVAILTLVMGFLMTGAIYLMHNYDVIKSDQKTTNNSIIVQKSLKNFIDLKKRYPCPASMTVAPDDPDFGLEDCSITPVNGRNSTPVLIGTVPVRTLNIPDKMIVDGYGNRHIYAVTETMTTSSADISHGLGAIYIHDENDNQLFKNDGYVIYALISPGEDNRGAYNIEGKRLKPCGSAKNCGGTATFISSSIKTYRGQASDFTYSFAFKASDLDYNWVTDNWSDCGKDKNGAKWTGVVAGDPETHEIPYCFLSYQARNVTCRDRQGTGVDALEENNIDKCGHTPKPIIERTCSLGPCEWYIENWFNEGGWSPMCYHPDSPLISGSTPNPTVFTYEGP